MKPALKTSQKKVRLFYLINPSHTINALSILKTYPDDNFEDVFLIHWPGASDEIAKELLRVFQTLLKDRATTNRIIFFPQSLKDQVTNSSSLGTVRLALNTVFSNLNVAQIFYSHDVDGGMFNLLCLVYPWARRICFGDTFGFVFERDVHLGLLVGRPTPKMKLQRFFQRCLMQVYLKYDSSWIPNLLFRHHEARLILPIDQSGRFLKMRPFSVIPTEIFKAVIDDCVATASDLAKYTTDLLAGIGDQPFNLLVTDNFAEGQFIDFDDEIEMYAEIVRAHCKPGSVIFLKSHPGETLPRNEAIVVKLSGAFTVIALDSRWKRYPLEIWKDLVINAESIISLSYPTLSLKYLYNIDVINPMTESFIKDWFKSWTWASYIDSARLYLEPLKRLPNWDHKSALYVGKR